LVACDIHPLNNLRVLQVLEHNLGLGADAKQAWIARWISDGFVALEHLIARYGLGFAFGSTPTFADCYLLPQVYSARRYGVPLAEFPCIVAVTDAFQALPAVQRAAPERQPNADRPQG
jgi:maleylpyruvate isomerase